MPGTLMHLPSLIIRQLLVDAGHDDGWPIYVVREVSPGDRSISIIDTQGRMGGRTMVDGEVQEHEGFQVMVRAATDADGFMKANELALYLAEEVLRVTVTIDSVQYCVHSVTRTSSVLPLGSDTPSSKRSRFTFNALTSIRRIA